MVRGDIYTACPRLYDSDKARWKLFLDSLLNTHSDVLMPQDNLLAFQL